MLIVIADDLEKVSSAVFYIATIAIQRMHEDYLIVKNESQLTTTSILQVIANFEIYKPIQVINLQPVEHQIDVDVDWVKEGF